MHDNRNVSSTWVSYLLCYTLYGLLLVIGYIVAFVLWRPALLVVFSSLLGERSYPARLFYMVSVVLLGGLMFIFLLVAEAYLRNGVARRQLLRRFVRLTVPLVIAGVIGVALRTFMA